MSTNIMSSNKNAYPPLHRNRRRSNPVSPTSPVFSRRTLDRSPRTFDVVSPIERRSADTTASDSPSPQVKAPSPEFDLPSFSQSRPPANQPSLDKRLPFRVSEENGRSKPRMPVGFTRPSTSDAIVVNNGSPKLEPMPKSSPFNNYNRFGENRDKGSHEAQGRHADGHTAHLRNFSVPSLVTDRSFQDEQSQPKVGPAKKSRLNLLNPMSLLARRRSSQSPTENVNLTISTMTVPALPDNFDPSIRGTITHDFSKPRTRRVPSHGDAAVFDSSMPSNGQPVTHVKRVSESTSPRLQPPAGQSSTHSPVFKEHFQDDRQALRPEQTNYLHSIAHSSSAGASHLAANMPAFAKKLPVRLPSGDRVQPPPYAGNNGWDRPLPKEPAQPPPLPPKRTPSPILDIPPASVLPRHMTSTSSRFSFQLGGSDSYVQEKLLEEKHKEHQVAKPPGMTSPDGDPDDDDYDDYDFDADDGLEERIPGVNADFENDLEDKGTTNNHFGELESQTPIHDTVQASHVRSLQQRSFQGFHFTPQTMTFSPTSTHNASQPTPRDDDGFAIGIADTRDSPHYNMGSQDQTSGLGGDEMSFVDGLGITTSKPFQQTPLEPRGGFDDSDLYFDDGEFDNEFQESEPIAFDEDIFDDETGRIRDIPAENARKLEAAVNSAGPDGDVKVATAVVNLGTTSSIESRRTDTQFDLDRSRSKNSMADAQAEKSVTGLTEGNLAAYHDALALAANEAAAKGKFSRNVSFTPDSEDDNSLSQYENSQPGVVSDESRISYNFGSSAIAEDDGFPFDDDMDDDLMIAEANAEALENDDDGFYGQEFGFYARSHGKNGSEMVNGGFFSSRGSNGVKRSHSGKANFQEPSLTPITERSEWSTRNSVTSLKIPGGIPGSAQSMPSPGIAQLLELDSPGYDDDMNFSTLLKLRRGAFGGSPTSINSQSANHPGSSPLAHMPSHSFSPQDHGHGRMASSAHSLTASAGIPESEEENNEGAETAGPTLTQNTPRKKSGDPSPTTPQDYSATSPSMASGERRKGSHSRNSSGAESVSYVRDVDGRWVLERRRTGDDGGLEVIDREYLAGARI